MPRQPRETSHGKRRTYSLKFKLDVIREYNPAIRGQGFVALAKKFGVPRSALRGWVEKRAELQASLKDDKILTRKSPRLKGGGRKPLMPEMEEELHKWILSRNEKGLRVKDLYISKMALKMADQMVGERGDQSLSTFKASTGWLDQFKKRHHLVSRRHTTDRKLPKNAIDLCRSFIQECQELIDSHKIKPKNIINMDQVPRYYETEPKSTIATRGIWIVLMTKGGMSHKRFTIAFSITGEGKHLKPHILISKRKNKLEVPPGMFVDVNQIGMWNEKICWDHFNEIVMKRAETQFFREPTLYIIDAYGPHINWLKAHTKVLEDYNIFVRIVPANLTSLLQPLDVAGNRSYQADYATQYDTYIADALSDPNMQTSAGNPKVPAAKVVAEWALRWIGSCQKEDMANAFKVCGLVPITEFVVTNLHPPLRALYDADLDLAEWNEQYGSLLSETLDLRPIVIVEPPTWFCPEEGYSLFRCLLRCKGISGNDVKEYLDAYVMELVVHMSMCPDLDDIFDDDVAADMVSGEMVACTLAVFAASDLEEWEIELTQLNLDGQVIEQFVYKVENPVKRIHLARIDDYFCVEPTGSHKPIFGVSILGVVTLRAYESYK